MSDTEEKLLLILKIIKSIIVVLETELQERIERMQYDDKNRLDDNKSNTNRTPDFD